MRAAPLAFLLVISGYAFAQPLDPQQKMLREIYQELVEINTTDSAGDCTLAANAMAAHLRSAGFTNAEMQVLVPTGGPKKGNLVARLKGSGKKRPLMLLAHLDVVEAKREDWDREPFKLLEMDGMFYGRGVSDDKSMAAVFVANMMRYKREGFMPNRDIILALTCDEELVPAKFNGVEFLLREHRSLIDAELVLNEGGAGNLDREGKPVRFGFQAGEKVFQSYQLEVTNPGGHSSTPTRDNAIYHLAEGLARLGRFDFPFKLTDTTRMYFERRGRHEEGKVADDMKAILLDSPDSATMGRFLNSPFLNATVRTTCVATMLEAGHATNALPQRAKAVVNCRILPGEPVEEVQKTLATVLADDKIKVTPMGTATLSPPPPLNGELLKHVEDLVQEMWPGTPVIPTMLLGATDGRFLNNVGIWTYGVSGMFHRPEGSFAHGLNERLPVKSLYEGYEFLYRLSKRLAS